MTAGLALTSVALEQGSSLLEEPRESAGVARAIRSGTTLLLGPIEWIDDEHYLRRERLRLEIRSSGWAPPLVEIARDGDVPVFVHTHPDGNAYFSPADDRVDLTIATEIQRITGCAEVASVVIAGTASQPTVTMRRMLHGRLGDPEMIRVSGPSPRFHLPDGTAAVSSVFDRQDRVYGKEGRRLLNQLTLGIVGAGGNGTPSHSQAMRLGFGTVITVDDDIVTDSTPTRGLGVGVADIGDSKVDTMARLNDRIGLGTTHIALNLNVRDPRAEDALAACDVILGCTDGHYSRLVLNRLAYYHLVPTIDLGVLITPTTTGEVEIDERVTIIGPGAACLLCANRIDLARARAENLDPAQRRALAAEGYVPDLDEPAPAVVNYTMMTSTFAMTTLLHRIFGIGDNKPTELIIQPDRNKIRPIATKSRPECPICSTPASWGQGFTRPRLGLTA